MSQRQSKELLSDIDKKAPKSQGEDKDPQGRPREQQPLQGGLAFAYRGFLLLARLTQARVWEGRTAAELKSPDSPFRKDLHGKVLQDRGTLVVMQDRTTGKWLPVLPRRAPVTRDLLRHSYMLMRRCVSCRRRRPVPFERQMGRLHAPLPSTRESAQGLHHHLH